MTDSGKGDVSNGDSAEGRQGIPAVVLASTIQSVIVMIGSCLSKEGAIILVLDALLDVHQSSLGESWVAA